MCQLSHNEAQKVKSWRYQMGFTCQPGAKKKEKKKNHICTEKIALVKLQVGEISDANCCVSEHWALC